MISEVEIIYTNMILRLDEKGDGRTVHGLVAPWDTPAAVMRPVPGFESFKRGAFTESLNSGRKIPLLLHHNEEEPAGYISEHTDDAKGQYATFRLVRTRAGDDAAELIREGMVTGLSVGGWAVPARTEVKRLAGGKQHIIRSEMRLDHIGLVRVPAYEDAQVLALRAMEFIEFDPVAAAKARKRIRDRLRECA